MLCHPVWGTPVVVVARQEEGLLPAQSLRGAAIGCHSGSESWGSVSECASSPSSLWPLLLLLPARPSLHHHSTEWSTAGPPHINNTGTVVPARCCCCRCCCTVIQGGCVRGMGAWEPGSGGVTASLQLSPPCNNPTPHSLPHSLTQPLIGRHGTTRPQQRPLH